MRIDEAEALGGVDSLGNIDISPTSSGFSNSDLGSSQYQVQIGDTLDVPTGGSLKLQMADGSVISVASGSRVTVAEYKNAGFGRAAKLLLAQGLLRVTSVTHPFEVSTAVGTAA